ncbi:MAG: Nucleoside phosphorylase [Candidatus Thermoplasmatota archaeon]|nr:Nucleoside phosphorylase [Candidatus Thermoplasmatota archaeon]
MEFYSRGRGIIRPEATAIDLPVEKAVICFTEGFYPRLVKCLGLSDARRAPHISACHRGRLGKEVALYKSEVGAPAVAMAMEVMIASGVRRILMLGLAGSLTPSCPVGSAVIPTWGIREEGTSYHYLKPGVCPKPSPGFVRELRTALSDIEPRLGGVWSTDAPYRETVGKVDEYARRGVLAVDMETTAMMAVATHRKAEFAAVLTISDLVHGPEWDPAFGTKRLNRARDAVCERAAQVVL